MNCEACVQACAPLVDDASGVAIEPEHHVAGDRAEQLRVAQAILLVKRAVEENTRRQENTSTSTAQYIMLPVVYLCICRWSRLSRGRGRGTKLELGVARGWGSRVEACALPVPRATCGCAVHEVRLAEWVERHAGHLPERQLLTGPTHVREQRRLRFLLCLRTRDRCQRLNNHKSELSRQKYSYRIW